MQGQATTTNPINSLSWLGNICWLYAIQEVCYTGWYMYVMKLNPRIIDTSACTFLYTLKGNLCVFVLPIVQLVKHGLTLALFHIQLTTLDVIGTEVACACNIDY